MARTIPLTAQDRPNWARSAPFLTFHLVPLLAVWTGVTWRAAGFAVAAYIVRMFFITGGYHRYFSHRSFKAPRAMQAILAFGGTSALQKGPLWWAANHRHHHRFSDTEADVHSPLMGFWHSHIGWIMSDRHTATDMDAVKDLARFPELRFLERFDWIAPLLLAVTSFLVAGWSGLVVGFFLSTVALWHGTFTVNSLAHVMGRRRYATTDTSRNSALVAFLTGGEGWHNNHHHYPSSARQGFVWWELDPTFYVLRALAAVHLVRDLREPPAEVRAASLVGKGCLDVGMVRAHWTKAAHAVASSRATLGHSVSEGVASVGEAFAGTRAGIEAKLAAERETLEAGVAASLSAVDAYARLLRQGRRSA
ncbi:MAG: acyl-CoA desaturase [Acidimicrobiales bacterium]